MPATDCAGDAHHPVASRPRPPPTSVEGGADSVDSSGGVGRVVRGHEKARRELLLKRRARALAVPTNDGEVRRWLRRLGEPVTLLREREINRRDRLRAIMANLDAEGHLDWFLKALEEEDTAAAAAAARGVEEEEESALYPCYREGSQGLARARVEIAKFSMARAASRIMRAKRRRDDPDEEEGD